MHWERKLIAPARRKIKQRQKKSKKSKQLRGELSVAFAHLGRFAHV
jgi:hypothetical protein